MSEEVIVSFEHKNYTWDGRRWYGTLDYTMPPKGMIHKLNALIPPAPAPKAKKTAAARA